MLTWPNIHLYINHFPVILSVLGLGAAIALFLFPLLFVIVILQLRMVRKETSYGL